MTSAPKKSAAIVRTTWFDVQPDPGSADIHAQTYDRVTSADGFVHQVRLDARLDAANDLQQLLVEPTVADIAGLTGRSVGRGFRAHLLELGWPSVESRIVRRMLWDIPVLAGLCRQTALLDHPGAGGPKPLSLRGVDQCSGWRAGGQMLTLVADHDGLLAMPLTPAVAASAGPPDDRARTGPDPGPGEPTVALAPMGTRRFRRTVVEPDPSGYLVTVEHRDSYADPDGIRRRLHEWTIQATVDGATSRITGIDTRPGQLPWVECPAAGASAQSLTGLTPDEVADRVTEWRGTATCTHLNDAARLFEDVDDLIRTLESTRR